MKIITYHYIPTFSNIMKLLKNFSKKTKSKWKNHIIITGEGSYELGKFNEKDVNVICSKTSYGFKFKGFSHPPSPYNITIIDKFGTIHIYEPYYNPISIEHLYRGNKENVASFVARILENEIAYGAFSIHKYSDQENCRYRGGFMGGELLTEIPGKLLGAEINRLELFPINNTSEFEYILTI